MNRNVLTIYLIGLVTILVFLCSCSNKPNTPPETIVNDVDSTQPEDSVNPGEDTVNSEVVERHFGAIADRPFIRAYILPFSDPFLKKKIRSVPSHKTNG